MAEAQPQKEEQPQKKERVSTRRWLGFVLGSLSVLGPALASPDRPSSATGWSLLIGSSVAAGLLTQSTLDEVTSKPGRARRRVWRSLTRRELLAWVLVLVVVAGCGSAAAFAVPWTWRMWHGCAEAVPVPVTAAPSLALPLQDVAAQWMDDTTGPGGCPKYAVQVSTAPDQHVLNALNSDWPVATASDTSSAAAELGPAPLIWFPDDYQNLDRLHSWNAGLIAREQFYAGTEFGLAMTPALAAILKPSDGWTLTGVAQAVYRRRLRLVRPDPSGSAVGRIAADLLHVDEGPVRGPDDTAVAEQMCQGQDAGTTVFVVTEQVYDEARGASITKAAPGTTTNGCWPAGDLVFVSLTPDPGSASVGADRAVALLRQSGSADRPSTSPASADAAKSFVKWLQDASGQEELIDQADFTPMAPNRRAPVKNAFPARPRGIGFGSGGIDDVATAR